MTPIRYNPTHDVGLSAKQADDRTANRLTNVTRSKITKSNFAIFRDNALTLFNAFNFGIGVLLMLVGAWRSLLFLLVVVLNITIGIVQEVRGRNLVSKLTLVVKGQATVIRDGQSTQIGVDQIVLDDVVVFCAGDQISVDSVVLDGTLEVNESLLTGESDTIIKLKGDSLLSGSFVVSGKCSARADKVGNDGFAARLALGAKKHKEVASELVKSMRKITKITSLFVIPIGIILFLQAYFYRGDDIAHAVTTSSAAVLGMLPRGLVLLISIALAAGVFRLAKQKVLVQDPRAIEMLARVDLVCLDKTGTLTTGNMNVTDFVIIDSSLPVDPKTALKLFVGNTTDNNSTADSMLSYFGNNDISANYKVLSSVPFSSKRKWSSITFEGLGTIIIGASERLLDKSINRIPNNITNPYNNGQRVLLAAYSSSAPTNDSLPDLSVFGLIVIQDEIRHNTSSTLGFFDKEGVGVKVISGDNPAAVSQVAKQAGLRDYSSYVDMSAIIDPDALRDAAAKYSVFGRVTPEQKKDLIIAFKNQGHTVAMVGDGVNDVLALREADCGIALACGSEATRQVSQVVLTDSDFTSLPNVVLEGRRVINNLTKIGGIFFIKTIYTVLLAVLMTIIFRPFPFVPIQITIIDLALEGYPPFFLSFERETHKPKVPFLSGAFLRALPFSIMITLSVSALYIIGLVAGIDYSTLASMMFLVLSFITVIALFRMCFPFNKFRLFLAITGTLMHFVFVLLTIPDWPWFLSGFLYISPMSLPNIIITVSLCIISIPIVLILIKFLRQDLLYKSNTK